MEDRTVRSIRSMPHGVWLVPQEWEYMLVQFNYSEGNWRPKFTGDEVLEGFPGGPSMSQFLSEVGAKRWELVTATPGMGVRDKVALQPSWHLIFKRPRD